MSFKIIPIEEALQNTFKITPVDIILEELLPTKGFQNRELTYDELWVIGLTMIRSGQLIKFTMRADKKILVKMEW